MKNWLSIFFLLCAMFVRAQNLNYEGVSYYSEDLETKQKTQQFFSHNGFIKVLESDNKIMTASATYTIVSKSIENNTIIYHCTGRDTFLNEVSIRIEYDRLYHQVKITPEDELMAGNYSVYFLVK
ncbi:MAG: hypothetical protein ACKOXB_10080 [Flavobacteriales bacterium]